jgi:hypothetical protein
MKRKVLSQEASKHDFAPRFGSNVDGNLGDKENDITVLLPN